jgi:RNA recognition motif-containing protein
MNIYVGNLSFQVDDQKLEELFSAYGEVSSAKVITDKYSGRSKGFGFVEMDDKSEAQAAIDELNGSTHNDRTITVNEARPRRENY